MQWSTAQHERAGHSDTAAAVRRRTVATDGSCSRMMWASELKNFWKLSLIPGHRPLTVSSCSGPCAADCEDRRTEDSGQCDASSGRVNISPNFGSLYNPVQKYFSESRHAALLLKRSALHIRYFNISIIWREVGTWTWIYNFSGHIKMHLGLLSRSYFISLNIFCPHLFLLRNGYQTILSQIEIKTGECFLFSHHNTPYTRPVGGSSVETSVPQFSYLYCDILFIPQLARNRDVFCKGPQFNSVFRKRES